PNIASPASCCSATSSRAFRPITRPSVTASSKSRWRDAPTASTQRWPPPSWPSPSPPAGAVQEPDTPQRDYCEYETAIRSPARYGAGRLLPRATSAAAHPQPAGRGLSRGGHRAVLGVDHRCAADGLHVAGDAAGQPADAEGDRRLRRRDLPDTA